MSETKLFEIFVNSLNFDVSEYLVEELTELQKKIVDDATFILKENIVGDVPPKSFGGSVKKNEEKFKELMEQAEQELKKDKYKDIKKNLKDYLKKLSELIIKTCVIIIPVKELPWTDVVFRSIPRITFDDKVHLLDNAIAYYGEINCFIGRTTIFGKMKDPSSEPLFAPFMGNLDLGGYKLDESQDKPKSQVFSYVDAIINSLDSAITKNQLAKYNEGYQRHGDPICDFLMKDDELLNSMEKITTALESERSKSEIAVSSIAVPLPSDKRSLIITTEEGQGESRFGNCFEALLKFSAACCQVPSPSQEAPPQVGSATGQTGGPIRTSGGQELKTWTAEDLANEAQKRLAAQPNIPSWSEEEIIKFAESRGSGIPEGMEVWKEDELLDLAEKRRSGGLNIPEWQPDHDMTECSNCGYSLRPGWAKCPVCDTPVGEKSSEEVKEEPEEPEESIDENQNEDYNEDENQDKNEDESQEPESKEDDPDIK